MHTRALQFITYIASPNSISKGSVDERLTEENRSLKKAVLRRLVAEQSFQARSKIF